MHCAQVSLSVTYMDIEGIIDDKEALWALKGDVGPPVLDEILNVGRPVGLVNMLLFNKVGQLGEALVT